jgi:alpha-glucuronidase
MKYESACKGILLFLCITLCALSNTTNADDGYKLWLKYQKIDDKEQLRKYQQTISSIIVSGDSKTCRTIRGELKNGLNGLLGKDIPFRRSCKAGSLIIGTPRSSASIKKMSLSGQLSKLGQEGYLIRSTNMNGKMCIAIAAQKDIGLLYGTFHLLRLIQTHQSLENLDVVSKPKIQYRLLDHWDNLDGSVERGYAGKSL